MRTTNKQKIFGCMARQITRLFGSNTHTGLSHGGAKMQSWGSGGGGTFDISPYIYKKADGSLCVKISGVEIVLGVSP